MISRRMIWLLALTLVSTNRLFSAVKLQPEVHAFTSFGWLDTTDNDWLGKSKGGSTQFWEAAMNATLRPLPNIALSGQVFARDFQRYDNGRAQLDWLYGEWRPTDALGVQVGRVKFPLGLFNESRDVDVARTTVFLPIGVYPLRTRDLFNSTDGGKVFGYLHLGPVGTLEYAAFAGHTPLSLQGGFATYLSDTGLGQPDSLKLDLSWGGMLHWHTPIDGLAVRGTALQLRGIEATSPGPGGTVLRSTGEPYLYLVGSVIYENGPLTLLAEGTGLDGKALITVEDAAGHPLIPPTTRIDRAGAGYLAAIWHFSNDIDATAAIERQWPDLRVVSEPNATRGIVALRWGITEHWSLKAEYQRIVGPGEALAADNPDGITTPWNLFALKTTVDF